MDVLVADGEACHKQQQPRGQKWRQVLHIDTGLLLLVAGVPCRRDAVARAAGVKRLPYSPLNQFASGAPAGRSTAAQVLSLRPKPPPLERGSRRERGTTANAPRHG
eukprot:scaffold2773_cov410-Prasinococcus_capsulatus_cf.AAC.1